MTVSKKLLIVDDSDFDRSLLTKALSRKTKFELVEARSASEALHALDKNEISLILLDVVMPETSGLELLERIRQKHNPIELPIIMLTAMSEVEDIVKALRNGANDYVTKPANFEITISRINTHLMISEHSHEMARVKELETITSLIGTYNHEINNPLAIALGYLGPNTQTLESAHVNKVRKAILRIADIVKKIGEVSKNGPEYTDYGGTGKILKVKGE